MRVSVAVGVRLPEDLVAELDELAAQQAKLASEAGGITIPASRSRTVRELIYLGLHELRKKEQPNGK